jgi:hypothetical protein
MPTIDESPCPSCGASAGSLFVNVQWKTLSCEACGMHLGGVPDADGRYLAFPYYDFAGTYDTKPHLWPCGCLINDGDAHRVGCPEYPEGRR